MAYDNHKNLSYSTVATAPSPATSGTSLVVATGDGAKFPTAPFNATVWPIGVQPTQANAEIVRVTVVSTDTLTITRAQEGSTTRTILVGDQIAATVTAKNLTDIETGKLDLTGGTLSGLLNFSGTTHAGIQLNSLTSTQRDALTGAGGQMIYNSTLGLIQKYEAGAWSSMSNATTVTKTVAPVGTAADYNTDGTADDVEIQSALNAVNSAGGGIVLVRAGTYDITVLVTLPSNVTLRGEGFKTQFKANASYSGVLSMFNNSDINGGNTNIVIEDLSIDGNQANRSGKALQDTNGHNLMLRNCTFCRVSNVTSFNGIISGIAIGRNSSNCIIEDSTVYNCWDHNILLIGNTTSALTCTQNIVKGCISYGAGQGGAQGVGIELAQLCTDNIIIGNISRNNLEGGIHCYYQSVRNIIANNWSYSNGQNGIAMVDASNYNVISGNVIKDCTQAGINCTISSLTTGGQNLTIIGNIISGCGYNGIRGTTSGDLGASVISGNTITACGTSATGNTQTGIYASNVVDLIITNNIITASYERSIRLDTANRCQISHNYITLGGRGGGSSNHAIFIDTGGSINDIQIIGNVIEANPGAGVLIGHNAFRLLIHGNTIKSMTSNAGLDLRGVQYSSITGNACSLNATQGIVLKQDASSVQSTYNVVSNNICTGNTLGGIAEQNTSDHNIFIGNNCNGNTASNFATVGVNDEIGHNITT